MSHWPIWLGALVACGLVAWAYDRAAMARNHVRRAWADVDAQLVKRHAYVPFLAAAVPDGIAEVTEAAATAVAAKTSAAADRFSPEERLSDALRRLFDRAGNSPALAANRDFPPLREQLEDIEAKLAGARRVYNRAAEAYPAAVDRFPASLAARLLRFERFGHFGPLTARPLPADSVRP